MGDKDDVEDGGVETPVRLFSYYISVISMLFRFVVIGVFAKASAEFTKTFNS